MNVKFGNYPIKLKTEKNQKFVFDIIRKKWIVLTPEEEVRQIWIHYLTQDLNISESKISIEKRILVNNKIKRFDICVYQSNLTPYILIECKSPLNKLSNQTLEQLSSYNIELNAKIFIVTNGVSHFGIQFKDQKLLIIDSLSEINI